MSVQQAPVQKAEPQRIIVQTERVQREPKEKPWKLPSFGSIDWDSILVPGFIIGGLIAIAFYRDDLTKLLEDLSEQVTAYVPPVGGSSSGGSSSGSNGGTTSKPPSSSGNGGGGAVSTGKQWYKANGPTATLGKGRQDGESNRWNKNVIGWQNGFEVMGYLTVTGMGSGSHIGLKMGGPNHSGGRECCWWDGGLRRNGTSYLEIEYPHPTNKNTKMLKSMGRNIDAGLLGVRWLNMKDGNARRVMFWVDKSGKANAHKWELLYDIKDTGQFMPTSYYDEVPNNQELEIRISDVSPSKIKWHTGPIGRKINASSNLAYSYYTNEFERISI